MSDAYFTSPGGETNYCNECKEPILEKNGRFMVSIKFDVIINRHRTFNPLFGHKTFCTKCFHKLFDSSWKGSQSIYKNKEAT